MLNKIIPVFNRACYGLIIPFISIIHVMLNTYRPNVHNLETIIDRATPFVKIFSIPYVLWFAYVFIVLMYFAVVDYKSYFRLLMSITTGMFICFLIFYYYPTTVPRPNIVTDDFFSRLIKDFIYKNDNPYNCFPSIHVLNALLVTIFFCSYHKGVILRAISILMCVSICLSTLFIKQHYILDVISSLILGGGVYKLFTTDSLWAKLPVKKVLDFIIPAKVREDIVE